MPGPLTSTPSGAHWRVGRRFLLWRPARRMRFDLDLVGAVAGLVAYPLLLVEWLAALTVALAAVLVRGVLRRSWTVTATQDAATERRLGWQVRGWRAAGALAERVRHELAEGADPSTHAHSQAVTARLPAG